MIEFLTANWDSILTYAMASFGVLAILSRFTPTPKDDALFGFLYDAISALTPNDRAKKVKESVDKVEDIVDTVSDAIEKHKNTEDTKKE